ncbi:MAG: hypothetical protein J5631_08860 [Spirochaetaceae bacterium]|nr:hypothetical protein [Spirochaetaceae bacterium]
MKEIFGNVIEDEREAIAIGMLEDGPLQFRKSQNFQSFLKVKLKSLPNS